jgi:hypothetical protein
VLRLTLANHVCPIGTVWVTRQQKGPESCEIDQLKNGFISEDYFQSYESITTNLSIKVFKMAKLDSLGLMLYKRRGRRVE